MAKTSQQAADDSEISVAVFDEKQRELDAAQQRLLSDPSNLRDLIRAGLLLREMGRFEESGAHLARAMLGHNAPTDKTYAGLDPSDPTLQPLADMPEIQSRILVQMGDYYAVASDCGLAERYYRAAVALSPRRAEPFVALGAMALELGQHEQAKDFFETATELEDDCDEAYSGLAIIHQKRQDYSSAFEMHLKCLELDTNNLVALLGLFQASCEMGNFSKIIYYLEVYLGGNPTDTSVLFCLATLYAREGRLYDARRVAQEILTHEPEKEGAARLLSKLNESLAGYC